jgi:hypothetical protein
MIGLATMPSFRSYFSLCSTSPQAALRAKPYAPPQSSCPFSRDRPSFQETATGSRNLQPRPLRRARLEQIEQGMRLTVQSTRFVWKRLNELAEKRAEKIQERMRGPHSRLLAYSVHGGVGLPPHPLFSVDRCGMPCGHAEVRPSCKGSSDVNRSIGFVVRGLWSVNARDYR